MRPSEKTVILGYLWKLVRYSFSHSEHFFNFSLHIRNRIVSFFAALLLMGLNALGWYLLDFVGSFLNFSTVEQCLFVTCKYGLICSQIWACWLVLTRLFSLWVDFPNRVDLVALCLIILIGIIRTMPQNNDVYWVQLLGWALTCLRPAICTRLEKLESA